MRDRLDPLTLDPASLRFRGLVGVGGIGSGMFFRLNGNTTLGREESRGGTFLERRDYCKLHIIAHYVRALLGPSFPVFPVGLVGDDDVGRRLLAEMAEAGLTLTHVRPAPGAPTLFSFCFLYPDGSGGNITTSDSACSRVDAAVVAEAEPELARLAGCGVALAAPEVPLEARARLLELATAHRLFRVASFTSEEVGEVLGSGLLRSVDLVSLNLHEAAACAGLSVESATPEAIVEAALATLTASHTEILVAVTHGRYGSWTWDGVSLKHRPAVSVPVENTAGAGDAFLAGLLSGLAADLSLSEAQQLATLAGAVSVTSPHTINPALSRSSLRALCRPGDGLEARVVALLEEKKP